MKRLVLLAVMGAVGLGVAPVSFAANCDRTVLRNDYDYIYCSRKLYEKTDAELNANYKALRAKLGPNSRNAATLKSGQLRWIRERDAECMSSSGLSVDCALEKTIERNSWLQVRLRECKTVGCMRSKLGD